MRRVRVIPRPGPLPLSVPLLACTLLLVCASCVSTNDPPASENPPSGPSGPPVFTQERLRVYTSYRPQVQHRDFNGVFDLAPGSARVVRSFWKERFNELTRPGHHGEFFIEFYDYMSAFAQAFPMESRDKERALDSLERSFKTFCLAVGVLEAFEAFQKDQMRIHGD